MRWIKFLLVAAWTAVMLFCGLVFEAIVLAIAAFATVLLMPASAMILVARVVNSINRWTMSGGRWDIRYSYGIVEAAAAFAASGFILMSGIQTSLLHMAKKLVHGTTVAFRHANGMQLLQPHELVLMLNLANDKAKFVKEHSLSDKMNVIVTDDWHMHFFNDFGEDITDLVKSIGEEAFIGCISLTSIVIPDSVKSIGSWTFSDCTSLKSIVIPDSIESVGNGAFSWCRSLKSISIPDSVKSIGKNAFWNCKSLKSIVFKDKTLKEVQSMENYPWGVEDESVFKAEIAR